MLDFIDSALMKLSIHFIRFITTIVVVVAIFTLIVTKLVAIAVKKAIIAIFAI